MYNNKEIQRKSKKEKKNQPQDISKIKKKRNQPTATYRFNSNSDFKRNEAKRQAYNQLQK